MHFQHPIKRFKRFFFVKSSQHKRRVYKDSTILLDWINTVQTTWSGKGGGEQGEYLKSFMKSIFQSP